MNLTTATNTLWLVLLLAGVGTSSQGTSASETAEEGISTVILTPVEDRDRGRDVYCPPVETAAPVPAPTAPLTTTGSTVITFTIPATTRVRMSEGVVTEVMTNTHEAPSCTDLYILEGAEGEASAEIKQQVLNLHLEGYFLPGEWYTVQQ